MSCVSQPQCQGLGRTSADQFIPVLGLSRTRARSPGSESRAGMTDLRPPSLPHFSEERPWQLSLGPLDNHSSLGTGGWHRAWQADSRRGQGQALAGSPCVRCGQTQTPQQPQL